jgi:hypothetical protein
MSVPPKLPDTLDLIDRVAPLLGARSRGDKLSEASRIYLIEEVGDYPTPKQARLWKRCLRERRAEIIRASP